MPNVGPSSESMFLALKKFLSENDLDINNIRSQSYDNAPNMAGKFEGLQALVRKENPLAIWVPCMGHSLNLVGVDAMNSCQRANLFFRFLEQIYVFFTGSPDRYKRLVECLLKSSTPNNKLQVPQRVDTTRWSSRADATKALVDAYTQILELLLDMSSENCLALGLYLQMSHLETCLYAIIWNDLLQRIDATNKSLQNPSKDFNTAMVELLSLQEFIESKRETFDYYESEALKISINDTYKHMNARRPARNARYDDGNDPDTILNERDNFKINSFLPVVDQLLVAIKNRIKAYEESHKLFAFLKKLDSLTVDEIATAANRLCGVYTEDIDGNLKDELIQFKEVYRHFLKEKEEDISPEMFMLKLIIQKKLIQFYNVEIILRIYATILFTNCSGERAMSKLKLIKDRLCSSMTEDTLNERTVLNSEFEILEELSPLIFQTLIFQ